MHWRSPPATRSHFQNRRKMHHPPSVVVITWAKRWVTRFVTTAGPNIPLRIFAHLAFSYMLHLFLPYDGCFHIFFWVLTIFENYFEFSKNQNIDSFNHVKFNFYFLNSNKTGRSPRTRSIFNLWKHPGRTESTARPRTNRSTARTLLTTLPSMPRQSFHLRRRTFFTKKFKFMAHLSFLF